MCKQFFSSGQPAATHSRPGVISYTGGGVVVLETVDVAGIFKYVLQKDVAGRPRSLRTESTPVTTAQLTARSSMAFGAGFRVAAVRADSSTRLRMSLYILKVNMQLTA
jgi:hypothetical protein